MRLDQSFAYDDLNRLTTVTQATGSTGYSYDASGNRTVKTIGGTAYTQTISLTSNRLAVTSDALGSASVTHDVSGNVTDDGSATYSYSDRGRMAGASTPGGSLAYAYNGLGLRAKKSGAAVSTGAAHYIYDEAGLLLGEYDANGTPVYETLYLNTTPVGAIKQTGTAGLSSLAVTLYNVYADHLDTPRVITKQDQTIVWRWDTAEAFGATAPNDSPSGVGTFTFNPRFPGQVFDSETGLNQNWNREYNPRWGRYAQSDPIGLDGGINTFGYVEGDPLSFVDPLGLQTSMDPWFGYGHDQAFQSWWHAEKAKGGSWFSSADNGFNPNKPYDIPNKECADRLYGDYQAKKAAEEAAKNAKKSNGPRPQRQRGEKKSVNELMRKGGGGYRGGGMEE